MHRVTIIHDPDSNHAATWKLWLELIGIKVDLIYDDHTFDRAKAHAYDLVIPLITIKDYVSQDNVRIDALTYFEDLGMNLLTPVVAIKNSSDKLVTAEKLSISNLPMPETVKLEQLTHSGISPPFIIKPRFGHSGEGICLVNEGDDYLKYLGKSMLAQKFIEKAECIRVIASQDKALRAYKKVPPAGELIANIGKGASRVYMEISDKIELLACSAAKALGGGLMGVDLLRNHNSTVILEANVPFGFDAQDTVLKQKLQDYIKERISIK